MDLAAETRRSLTTPRSWASAGHLAAAWSLYVLLAVVAVRSPLVLRVPAWFIMGWLLLGNGAIVHEATHRHLFRSPRSNRWIGAIAGASLLMPWGVYRPYHLAHHRYTAAIEDPEGPPLHFRSRREYPLLAVGGLAFIVRLHGYGVAAAVGRPPTWLRSNPQRRVAIADTALCLIVLVAAIVLATANLGVLCAVWFIPWLVAAVMLVPLVLVTEHYGATVGTLDAAANTRTIVSNTAVRWVYWNNNFHTAHHQLPTVIHQRLAQFDDANRTDDRGAWISPGYLAFHRQLWTSLPWRDRSRRPAELPRNTPLS